MAADGWRFVWPGHPYAQPNAVLHSDRGAVAAEKRQEAADRRQETGDRRRPDRLV